MRRRGIAALLPLLMIAPGCAFAQSAAADGPAAASARTLYELRVTNAGTRSQGIRGVLFDASGREIAEDGAGQSVDTPVGRFSYRPCQMLWSVCGYFRDGERAVTHPGPTLDMDRPQVIVWRLALTGDGAGARWTAQLLDDRGADVTAPEGGAPLPTPLGAFHVRSVMLGGVAGSGPLPDEWPEAGQR